MDVLVIFGWGIAMSFLGLLPIGMISMSILNSTIERGKRAGFFMSFGASLVAALQAFFSIYFITFFQTYPFLETAVQFLAVPILIILGMDYWRSANRPIAQKLNFSDHTSVFYNGLWVSSLNVLVYPYWILWGGIFIQQGVLNVDFWYICVFSIGVGVGAVGAFGLYVLLAVVLAPKLRAYNKRLRQFIALFFWAIALWLLLLNHFL